MRISNADGSIYQNIASVGISGSVNGHIRSQSEHEPFVMYYYLKGAGLSETGYAVVPFETDLSDKTGSLNQPVYVTESEETEDVTADDKEASVMALISELDFQTYLVNDNREIMLSVMDQEGNIRPVSENEKQRISFTGHDEDIVDFDGINLIAKKSGSTKVVATLDDTSTEFMVTVSKSPEVNKEKSTTLKCYEEVVRQSLTEKSAVQLCAFSESKDGTFREHYTDLTFSDYDTEIININESGIIKPVSEGKTDVTITYGKQCVKITVIITP